MAGIDIFNNDAFGLIELTAALEETPYLPQWLGSLNIFQEKNIRGDAVWIEKRDSVLTLVPTTPRGSPLPQLNVKPRDARAFRSVRIAKGDRLNASELDGIRAFGSDTELEQVAAETLRREQALRNDVELTHEFMRLGAIQGLLLDADGSVIYNWFQEWGYTQPAEIVFNFATLIDGQLRKKLTEIKRAMRKVSKGAWSPTTQIYALCGDNFYDTLVNAPEVRVTYLGWAAAADLRDDNGPWEAFPFGGITWINYEGTIDNADVAIDTNKCKFFPVGSPDSFMRVNSPGEFFDTINRPGQPFYALTVPDKDRNAWVDIELYSYPLYIANRPQMLFRGRLA